MLHASAIYTNLFAAVLAAGNPLLPRAVDKLNNVAFNEAQQRDDAATRALANVQIKTADDRCLFVDVLSGDSRANLTPLQIADCSSVSAGQGFDVVTKGKHNDKQDQALVVSTLTQACLSFDPRRPSDSQVHMFSCGGRADGGGEVSDSQLFAFNGTEGTIALTPQNSPGQCLVAAVDKVVIAVCDDKDDKQKFTFGGDAGKSSDGNITQSRQPTPSSTVVSETPSADVDLSSTAKPSKSLNISTPLPLRPPAPCSFTISTTTIPVSGAGGNLNPTAAAAANQFDTTADRALESINLRAPDGRCLSLDPTAGDFRQNLIPVGLATCSEDSGQKFDVVTRGKHNDGKDGKALLVSVLTNGCLSFDSRRQQGDTVTIFSCGGRADGGKLLSP
ncbi:hypothetical protein BM221_009037 [Beauveria bassiana]|uniref:Ricin-type beta-trefoil lectin domain-containing protein n=1 Tax=Beauveria bassiana TaxID=176275 RepID=A0A2N6NC40_BEABA|nr:hypothetical protein BM221_009037 [Beauveria bassiana]